MSPSDTSAWLRWSSRRLFARRSSPADSSASTIYASYLHRSEVARLGGPGRQRRPAGEILCVARKNAPAPNDPVISAPRVRAPSGTEPLELFRCPPLAERADLPSHRLEHGQDRTECRRRIDESLSRLQLLNEEQNRERKERDPGHPFSSFA